MRGRFLGLVFAISASSVLLAQIGTEPAPPTIRVGIVVKVPNFMAARDRVRESVQRLGGSILQAGDKVNEKGRRYGHLSISIPGKDLDTLLKEVRGSGKVADEKTTTTENQGDIQQIDARLVLLAGHSERLSALRNGTRRLRATDQLYILDRIFAVQTDMERLKLQRGALVRRSRTGGIHISLFEPYLESESTPMPKGIGERFRLSMKQAATDTLASIAELSGLLLKLLVWSPIWIPLALLGRKWWKRFTADPAVGPPTKKE